MDYLDSRKRRAYTLRLVVGYFLVAIVIALGTVIIVYGANGYGINTKTGQIVQNALLFTDSTPSGAEIFLNGKDQQATTSARLVLPAAKYTLTLKKPGYQEWTREFVLSGQSVARYVYPFLFPEKPLVTSLHKYSEKPAVFTETPDRKWLLVEKAQNNTDSPMFDEYDLSTLDQKSPVVQQVSIPPEILTNYSAGSTLKVVEWSSDNNNILLEHSYPGGTEYVVFNRNHPDQSFNVNSMFNVTPTQVSLYNKKADQLYIYSQPDGSLRLGDTGSQTLGPIILKNILAYKPYGKNLLTYVTAIGEPDGTVATKIWNSGQTYKLNEYVSGSKYLIDAAQFNGHFYYISGSDKADRINIYKDPLDYIKNPAYQHAVPMLALHNPGANQVGFSDNARFIGAENGQRFAVFDFETDSLYQYGVSEPLDGELSWMDGHRYIGSTGEKVFVMDYDGTNKHLLTPTALSSGGLFSTDYRHMLVVSPAAGGGFTLQDVDMRAGTDLPQSKQNS